MFKKKNNANYAECNIPQLRPLPDPPPRPIPKEFKTMHLLLNDAEKYDERKDFKERDGLLILLRAKIDAYLNDGMLKPNISARFTE